jgi:hypothetical protein
MNNLGKKYILGLNLNDNRYIHIGIVNLVGDIVKQKSHVLNILQFSDKDYIDRVIALRTYEMYYD